MKQISGRKNSAKSEGAIVTAKLNTRDAGGGLTWDACDCHKDVSVYVDLKYDARSQVSVMLKVTVIPRGAISMEPYSFHFHFHKSRGQQEDSSNYI